MGSSLFISPQTYRNNVQTSQSRRDDALLFLLHYKRTWSKTMTLMMTMTTNHGNATALCLFNLRRRVSEESCSSGAGRGLWKTHRSQTNHTQSIKKLFCLLHVIKPTEERKEGEIRLIWYSNACRKHINLQMFKNIPRTELPTGNHNVMYEKQTTASGVSEQRFRDNSLIVKLSLGSLDKQLYM